jgi:glycosyltransferase involved in cell wall biosynthesis
MQENRPDISIVILCYRSEAFAPIFIGEVKKSMDQSGLNYELVLVANFFSNTEKIDRTVEIVTELAKHDPKLLVVAKEKQGMMGWDMRSGLSAARGETIAVIDGDGQMPPEDVLKVYQALKSGPYAIAKTYRDQRFDGFKRRAISKVYNILLKSLFPKVTVRDANSKPKIFTRDGLTKLSLTSDDWFIDAEIIIQASYLGLKINEVPTQFHPNKNRKSFIRPSAIAEFLKNLIMYRWKMFLAR